MKMIIFQALKSFSFMQTKDLLRVLVPKPPFSELCSRVQYFSNDFVRSSPTKSIKEQ